MGSNLAEGPDCREGKRDEPRRDDLPSRLAEGPDWRDDERDEPGLTEGSDTREEGGVTEIEVVLLLIQSV